MRRGGGSWVVVGALAGVAALLPAHWSTSIPPISRDTWPFGGRTAALVDITRDLGLWWGLFAVTAFALLRAPRRPAVVTALVLGLATGLVSLVPTTVFSDDLYRYAWDGRVQAAGINPYRHPPDSLRLNRLRDDWLWPTADECAAAGKIAPCTRINRPGVPTIYPPAAQWWFRLAQAVLPRGSRDLGYEVLGLLVALAVAVLLVELLRRLGRDPRLVVLWSCCPLVAVEAVQSAHVDVLAALAVVGAFAVLLVPRRDRLPAGRGRWTAAALLLGLAGLVKLYPFVLLPAVVQRHRLTAWTATAALTVFAYLPYLLGVGGGVTGYLRGYLHEEGYGKGTRFLLLSVTGLTGTAVKLLAVTVLAVVLVLALLRRLGPPLSAALTLFVTVLFVATPGEAWYELVLLVLVSLTGSWQWLGLALAEYVSFLTALLGDQHLVATRSAYLAALILGVGITALDRLTRRLRDQPCGVVTVGGEGHI